MIVVLLFVIAFFEWRIWDLEKRLNHAEIDLILMRGRRRRSDDSKTA